LPPSGAVFPSDEWPFCALLLAPGDSQILVLQLCSARNADRNADMFNDLPNYSPHHLHHADGGKVVQPGPKVVQHVANDEAMAYGRRLNVGCNKPVTSRFGIADNL
jgi:hypothetical protein